MPKSTTTFHDRVKRIEKRAAKAGRRRRRGTPPRLGNLLVLAAMGMLVGGAAFAWDGDTLADEWALPGLEWALTLLP